MADNPSVARPTSGAYGETADLERLKQSLPAGSVGVQAPVAPPKPPLSPEPPTPPSSPTPPGRPVGSPPPPGLPAALFAPTDRPDVPVGTPLSMPAAPTPAAADPSQARVAILDALANDPGVSSDTRTWAKSVLRILVGG